MQLNIVVKPFIMVALWNIMVCPIPQGNVNKWLNNNIKLHFLWNTSIWHSGVFYVHIIVYLKLQLYYRRYPRVVQLQRERYSGTTYTSFMNVDKARLL